MTELNQTLPLLPLTSGVVLPGMVFTMALETDEAKTAAEAAGSVGGELVLVPHIDGRYASVGVISKILETGELPGGPVAVVVSGLRRATIGTAVPGTGQALWVQVDPIAEDPETPRAQELGARVPGRAREHPPHPGGAPHGGASARHHRRLADRRSVGVLARPEPGPEGRGPRDRRPRGAPAPRPRVGRARHSPI